MEFGCANHFEAPQRRRKRTIENSKVDSKWTQKWTQKAHAVVVVCRRDVMRRDVRGIEMPCAHPLRRRFESAIGTGVVRRSRERQGRDARMAAPSGCIGVRVRSRSPAASRDRASRERLEHRS